MQKSMTVRTRFAPSPTGLLHLGHAYSALFAADCAARGGGVFVLRIEDIDRGRCRAEFDAQIREDLAWLGLEWEQPVRRQSEHFDAYRGVLSDLSDAGLMYPCFCTRKDIEAEINAAGHAPHGPDGPLYPGTCRTLDPKAAEARIEAGEAHALRLRMDEALRRTGPLRWHDAEDGEVTARPERFGDVVLGRKDVPTSYHLAVTWDDHLQDISLVTRGRDLFAATDVHRLLQALLGLATPDYHHHRLLTDKDGKRFAKRDRAKTLKSMRDAGLSPADVKKLAGWHDDAP